MRDASDAILYVGHCFCYEQSLASISASVNADLEVLTGAFRSPKPAGLSLDRGVGYYSARTMFGLAAPSPGITVR